MQAFWELSSCRATGFGEGPIPWTSIAEYVAYRQIAGSQETALFHHVRALDNVYLKHANKDSKDGKGSSIQATPPSEG